MNTGKAGVVIVGVVLLGLPPVKLRVVTLPAAVREIEWLPVSLDNTMLPCVGMRSKAALLVATGAAPDTTGITAVTLTVLSTIRALRSRLTVASVPALGMIGLPPATGRPTYR